MIRKIKTGVNRSQSNENTNNTQNSNNTNSSYDIESKNASIEELDLNTYTSDTTSSTTTITEENVLNAIDQNFANNRNMTNEMNNQVYSALKDKLANYIASNGGNL